MTSQGLHHHNAMFRFHDVNDNDGTYTYQMNFQRTVNGTVVEFSDDPKIINRGT